MQNAVLSKVESLLSGHLSKHDIEYVLSVLDDILPDMIEGEEHVTVSDDELLEMFISSKRLEGCSEKTLTYYRATIDNFMICNSKNFCDLTTDDIRNYLSDYQFKRHSSKVTIDNIRRIFSSFYSWLEDEEYILKSPVKRIHKIKIGRTVKNTFSDEELESIRESCACIRDLAIVDLLSSTGMRVGELVRLNRDDLDFNERECVVFGKGDCERVVYFDARTKIHIKKYLETRTDSNPALFTTINRPYRRLSTNGVETMLKSLKHISGVDDIYPHKFRRSMATRALDKGMPIEQVQRILGHVRIDTTLHYAMVDQDNVKASHRRFVG